VGIASSSVSSATEAAFWADHLIVDLDQEGADESGDGGFVGEDPFWLSLPTGRSWPQFHAAIRGSELTRPWCPTSSVII
jgi:hypothetical protein